MAKLCHLYEGIWRFYNKLSALISNRRFSKLPFKSYIMPIKVAIIDNDAGALSGLGRLIDATEGFRFLGRHANVVRALKEFSISPPDVLLMDINLPGVDGIDWVRRVKAAHPDLLILVLTDLEFINVIFSAISAGAVGYLLKRSSPEQVIKAIHEVYQGGSPMTTSIARVIVGLFQQATAPVQREQKLSTREQEVLDYLAWGYSYQKIADELKISYATVHTHIRHIYKKLKVNSRTGAVTWHLRQTAGLQLKRPVGLTSSETFVPAC